MGWSGPASLFSISTLPPLLTGETGLRILPAAPPLQILQVIRGLQSEDFQVPVLVEQRGGTDEDEQTHPHDHRPGQFHPLSVGAASAPRGLWRGGYITRHRNTHPHQNHHDTQQQPDARGGAQVQLGPEGIASPQVSAACWETNGRRLGGVGGSRAPHGTGCSHPLVSDWGGIEQKRGLG